MQKKVKVLLLKPLINKGNAGEVVEVKLHFAQQVLVPNEVAVIYDKQAQNQHEAHMKKVAAHKSEILSKVKAMVEVISTAWITFEKQATDNEALYDSVTDRSIAQYLMQTHHISLTANNIVLDEKIEQLGEYTVQFIYESIKANVPVKIVRK
jgi:ribosomal protein L9